MYCNITLNEKGKKLANFGETWGAMGKSKANATFEKTGGGLYIIDIDTKNIPEKYKTWVKSLGKPTVESAKGYHYYIKSDAPMRTHGNIFKDENFNVDIRGDKGLIFTDYWGEEKNIWYKKVGDVIKDKNYSIFKSLPKEITEPRKIIKRENTTPMKKSEVKSLLSKLDPDIDYNRWYKVGMILHSMGNVGFKLFNKWSKKGKKYEGEDSIVEKWNNFDKESRGDLSIGTLVYIVHGEKDANFGFSDQGEALKIVKPKKKKRKSKNKLNSLPNMLNDDLIKERSDQISLFDGVLTQGMHTFIYGAAGSNKTTSIGWIMLNVLKRFPEKKVHFWSFDASQNHEQAIYDYAKSVGVESDRFMLSVVSTSEDFYTYYSEVIEEEINMKDIIVVTDTFKFISKNVNDKNANKEALHFIKDLQKLGATAITLGHSNKDGVKQSGTAEIEQDTEAILRIDRVVDDFKGEVTLTISEAGRVRLTNPRSVTLLSRPKGTGYNYLYSAMETMEISDKTVDIASSVDIKAEEMKQEKELEIKRSGRKATDQSMIDEIVFIIENLIADKNSKPIHQKIKQFAKMEASIGGTACDRILREYNNDVWTYKPHLPKGGGRRTKIYKLIKDKK